MEKSQKELLNKIADITDFPDGAYNIRVDGGSIGFKSTENITIIPRPDKNGLEVHIKAGTKNESVHIPVIIEQSGLKEVVYNDFYVGEDADVIIIAGCGIHNESHSPSEHDGIHSFYLEKNARLKYTEKHYGAGSNTSKRVFNPTTNVHLKENSYMEIDTVQIEGVTDTKRVTTAVIEDNASLVAHEKLMTDYDQYAHSEYNVELNGENSGTHVVSRSVAKGKSKQIFVSKIDGNNKCSGHSECDAIIMGESIVQAIPEITANHIDASLIHEAAIGKIAGDQIVKLMTLGLTESEAEKEIINGFLK